MIRGEDGLYPHIILPFTRSSLNIIHIAFQMSKDHISTHTVQPLPDTPPSGGKGAFTLTAEMRNSLRRPSGRTLRLIDKALAWLRPFESPKAQVTSPSERHALLELLDEHRMVLMPYIDVDRIETNLRSPHYG